MEWIKGGRRQRALALMCGGLVVAAVFGASGGSAAGSAPSSAVDVESSVDDGRLHYAQHFRQVFGLRNDLDYVREMENRAGDHPSEDRFGLVLTDKELADLDARSHVNATIVPEIERWAREAHPTTFGGVFLDHGRSGQVRVMFTANVEARSAEVRERWGEEHSVEAVEYSERELQRARAAVESARARLRAEGIELSSIGDYVQSNEVKAWVETARATTARGRDEVRARVHEVAGNRSVKVDFGRGSAPANRLNDFSTLRGGVGIRTQKISNGHIMTSCTTGPTGYKDVSGVRQLWQITAAHCVPQGQRNPTPAGTVGSTTDVRFLQYSGVISRDNVSYYKISGATDAVVTRVDGRRSARGWMYTSTATQSHPIQRTQSASGDRVNDIVCHGGITSTQGNSNTIVCGPITSRNISFSLENNWMHTMREAQVPAAGGDSGGLIYGDQPDRGLANIAQGVFSACGRTTACPSGWVYYSHLSYVVSEMGLHGILLN